MKKPTQKEINGAMKLKKQAVLQQELVAMNVRDCMKRVLAHRNTNEDILYIGEKITEFQQTDLFIIIQTAVEYVVNDVLSDVKPSSNPSEALGIQKGARRVLETILGLETQSIIINREVETKNKLEEQDKIDNGEIDVPQTRDQGNVGI